MFKNRFNYQYAVARLFKLLTFYVLSAVSGLFAVLSVNAYCASVSSEIYTDNTKNMLQATALKGKSYQKEAMPFNILLDPVTHTEKTQLRSIKNQPLKIGFGRAIPSYYTGDLQPLLTWNPLASGAQIGTFSVTSPDAKALRLALQAEQLPEGVELRFFSFALPQQVFGPFTRQDIMKVASRKGAVNGKKPGRQTVTRENKSAGVEETFWSPVIEGDTLGVEIYVPSVEAQYQVSLKVVQVSHLAYSVLSPDEKSLSDIGRSGSCNIDVACQTIPANVEDAVAKIIFSEGGSSFLCTGSLLNDNEPDSTIPYFMTANHCLDTQAAASTVNSFWFFKRAACNGVNPTSVTQLTGGGDLLETGTVSDYTLLLLRDPLPSGVTLAGWTDQPLAQNTPIIGVHHPAGDLKKWSQGNSTGFAEFGGPVNGTGSHIQVIWNQGTTEGGSSGSGIFDAQGKFRGNLHGGSASCSNPSLPDYYGRFDITYQYVKRWLFDTPTLLTSGIQVSDTVQSGQWKEYKLQASAGQSELNVELSGLSQDADLYVRRGVRPTNGSYDCRPFLAANNAETCTISNNGNNIYYIGVQGYDSGSTAFTLKATLLSSGSGNGVDTVGLYRPQTGTFYLKDSNVGGVADVTFRFGPGNSSWVPMAGDWNGL
jgi:hypothetical protein